MWHLHLKCFATESEQTVKQTLKRARSENVCIKGLSGQQQSKHPMPGNAADFRNSAGNDFQPSNRQMKSVSLQVEHYIHRWQNKRQRIQDVGSLRATSTTAMFFGTALQGQTPFFLKVFPQMVMEAESAVTPKSQRCSNGLRTRDCEGHGIRFRFSFSDHSVNPCVP